MTYALEVGLKPSSTPSAVGKPVMLSVKATLTTSGAVSNSTGSDRGCSLSKPSGTGLYTATFPALRSIKHVSATLQTTTTGADRTLAVTGSSADTSGAATVSVTNMAAGSAADGTSGDVVYVTIWGDA